MSRHYYLEGYLDGSRHARRMELSQFPAVVGRQADCAVQLNFSSISRQHARFELQNDQLLLVDLDSTNGTFVNRERINLPTIVAPGFVIHFGEIELRLMLDSDAPTGHAKDATRVGIKSLSEQFSIHTHDFFELMSKRQVRGYHQIITRADGSPYGYELLGRGANPVLGESPAALLNMAENLGLAVALSQLFREQCFADASQAGLRMPLFFNTHPEESRDFDKLLAELKRLRKKFPELTLVFEVHEAAITDLEAMRTVRRELDKLGIALAYDDFGAGQTRLLELAEVPPDFLKFDIALVRDIQDTDSPRYQLLSTLNTMIKSFGIQTLAEGIETETTATLCRDIGIDYFQGFLFGRPEPILPNTDPLNTDPLNTDPLNTDPLNTDPFNT